MKTFTRVIAVVMMVALLASLMVACGAKKEENHIDNNLVGTWTQTSESDGNWTWTFNSDGTCKLVGDDNFDSSGTYMIPEEDVGKIKIKLEAWDEVQLFTYTATDKKLQLQNFDITYFCDRQ